MRKLLVGSAIAVGAVLSSASFSPSEAAVFRGRLVFDTREPIVDSISDSGVFFTTDIKPEAEVDSTSTGNFLSLEGNTVTLMNLILDGSGQLSSPQELFAVDAGPTFTVTSLADVRVQSFGPSDFFGATLRGFFSSGTNSTAVSPSSFAFVVDAGGGQEDLVDFSLTTVPTPALLPGLIGMGFAALRRRKSEDQKLAEA